ncbi:MAG TPA: DUF4203 domain-containing protein [Vicinamibacterales bacterium]|nr:DUF4203 domain-containing protein [Vicinamibacterales bacterium]
MPANFEFPAAVVLLLGGTIACFAGYRLFRVVLAIYGFIFGAMLASSVMGISNHLGMLIAALVGGILGAVLFTFAYYVSIGLIGAGMGAFLLHVVWDYAKRSEPPSVAVIIAAVAGAVVAVALQRYVIIISTAFSGAWTMIVGGLALAGDRAAERAAASGNVWILYPFSPAAGPRWVPFAWVILSLFGIAVQVGLTGRRKY